MSTIKDAPEKAIKLRPAYVRGARKSLGIKPMRKAWWGDKLAAANIHAIPSACKIVRIGPDEIAVTDGEDGYTPFRLSALKEMLKQASRLPITTEFRTDV